MTEGSQGTSSSTPHIPPKPALTPDELHKKQAKEARAKEREDKRAAKDARFDERRALRHSSDPGVFHGHHVIGAAQLKEAFPEEDDDRDNPVRFRHRLLHGITLTVLGAMIVTAVVLAIMVSRGDLDLFPAAATTPKPTPQCPAETFNYPPNAEIHLNVYNGTHREGLAGGVAEQLKQRGYLVDIVDNKSTSFYGSAVVVSGPTGQAAAFNLQRNIPGSDYVQDSRTDGTVDVYLTSGFSDLAAPDLVDQTPGTLSCPRLSAAPTSTSSGSETVASAPAP